MRRGIIPAVVLMLVLTACEMSAEIDVRENGSGHFGMSFAIEDSLARSMGMTPAQLLGDFKRDLANDPVKWNVTDVKRKGVTGVRATFPFSDLADLKSKIAMMSSQRDANGGAFGDVVLERRGDGWVFEGLSGNPTQGQQDLPLPPEQLDAMMRLELRVTLPGAAGSTNAVRTERSGDRTTFIWQPKASDASSPKKLHARTVAAGAGAGLPLAPIGLGAAALALLALFLLNRRKPQPQTIFYMEGGPALGAEEEHAAVAATGTDGLAPDLAPPVSSEASPDMGTVAVVTEEPEAR